MKKFSIILTIIYIFTYTLFPEITLAKSSPPSVSAESSILINADSGEILWSKNPNAAYPPASTTKIMTALLTLEKCKDFNQKVTIGKRPPQADGNSIYVVEGEEITVNDLFHALIIESANDTAEALAEYLAGSVENFAVLMNERAKQLGCTTANFVNPSGLYEDGHKASSKDLALIMKELIKYPKYLEVSQKPYYIIEPTNKNKEKRIIGNNNRLVKKTEPLYYEPALAGKTGYTDESRHSYVAAAKKDGQTLIAAFVRDDRKTYFEDATSLFEYGFNNFTQKKLFSKNDLVTNYSFNKNNLIVPLLASKDFFYVTEKNCNNKPIIKIKEKDLSNDNFKCNDEIMEASVLLNNKEIGTIKLLSGIEHEVTKLELNSKSMEKLNDYGLKKAHYSIYIVTIIITLMVIGLTIVFKHKK